MPQITIDQESSLVGPGKAGRKLRRKCCLAFVFDGAGYKDHLRRFAASLRDHRTNAVHTLRHQAIVDSLFSTICARQSAEHPNACALRQLLRNAQPIAKIFKKNHRPTPEDKPSTPGQHGQHPTEDLVAALGHTGLFDERYTIWHR